MVDKIVDNIRITVLGLGEAGSAIATDLAAVGVEVVAWDPAVSEPPAGVALAASPRPALAGATAVLSVNRATVAVDLGRELAPVLERGQLFADLNTAAPSLKVELAGVVERAGGSFVDVALMGPVSGTGVDTPWLASGAGADRFAALFRELGTAVEVVGPVPGEAALRKLLRSVFMKGIAAAALESITAARAAGCEQWLRGELGRILAAADPPLLDRLLTGSRRHASRRVHEMDAAREALRALGVPARVATAARGWLEQLDAEPRAPAEGTGAS